MAKHWSLMSTPRMQGRSAYLQGAAVTENPYENDSISHRKWRTGYNTERKKQDALGR